MSRWGVGPSTFVPSMLYTLAAWAATSAWPDALRLRWLPDAVVTAGVVFTAAGLVMWTVGAVTASAPHLPAKWSMFCPFTTTLIQIVLHREPLPLDQVSRLLTFLESSGGIGPFKSAYVGPHSCFARRAS